MSAVGQSFDFYIFDIVANLVWAGAERVAVLKPLHAIAQPDIWSPMGNARAALMQTGLHIYIMCLTYVQMYIVYVCILFLTHVYTHPSSTQIRNYSSGQTLSI